MKNEGNSSTVIDDGESPGERDLSGPFVGTARTFCLFPKPRFILAASRDRWIPLYCPCINTLSRW